MDQTSPVLSGWCSRLNNAKANNRKLPETTGTLVYIFDGTSDPVNLLIQDGVQLLLSGKRPFDWTGPHQAPAPARKTAYSSPSAPNCPRFRLETIPQEKFKEYSFKRLKLSDSDQGENLHTPTEEQLATMARVPTDGTWRVRADRQVSFGDGGRCTYCFPLYKKDNILSEPARLQFLNALTTLANHRKDRQGDESIVEDIIDPNLCPRRHDDVDWESRTFDELMVQWKRRNPDTVWKPIEESEYINAPENKYRYTQMASTLNSDTMWRLREAHGGAWSPAVFLVDQLHRKRTLPPPFLLRESYSWIPSTFSVTEKEVKIIDPINMLPRNEETENVYLGLEAVFLSMVPAFQELNLIPRGSTKPTNLKVVCKAQRYNLEPQQTYDGFWHREGQNERIVAVGVYYVDVPSGLKGGCLKFRAPDEPPDPGYNEYAQESSDVSVKANSNSACIFSNILPHRVRLLENQSDSFKQRTFINFFIVDPDYDLPTTTNQITSSDLIVIIQACVVSWIDREFPSDVMKLILAWCNLWSSMDEAFDFRDKARVAMRSMSSESGWAHVHYGNCGVQRFAPCIEAMMPGHWLDDAESLHHTQSDIASDGSNFHKTDR